MMVFSHEIWYSMNTQKNDEKKCHLRFTSRDIILIRHEIWISQKNTKFTTNTMENTYTSHTQFHAIHLDIEQHYHRAFNFFWFFLFIYVRDLIRLSRYYFGKQSRKYVTTLLSISAKQLWFVSKWMHTSNPVKQPVSQPTIQLEHINSDRVEVHCTGMLAIECSPAPINFA